MSENKGGESLKEKADWDLYATEIYIKLCLDQVNKGERNGTSLTRRAWTAIRTEFNAKTKRNYDKTQIRNKWDNLRKEWQAWEKLIVKESGLGWDTAKNTIEADSDWWEKKIRENKRYAKFRNKGLDFANELTILFKDVVASGKHAWAPSSGILPNDDDNEDVYRPSLENIDVEEGSGDSDENVGAETNVSPNLQNINLNTSQGNTSDKSDGKRKRNVNNEGKKKAKVTDRGKIADAFSRMARTSEERTSAVNSLIVRGPTVGEVMAEVKQIESITSDYEFYGKVSQIMLFKSAREMFMALKDDEMGLMHWLKCATSGPLPFPKN